VTCLPKDLPEYIEVDVAPLSIGDILHLSDLKLPAGVVLEDLEGLSDEEREEHDVAVVSVHASTMAAEMDAIDTAAEAGVVPAAAGEPAAEGGEGAEPAKG
jgi:large subunit ribosomal protein L25